MRDVVDSLWAAKKRQEEKKEAGISAQLDTGKEAREDLARKDSAHYFSTQGWAALDPMPRLAVACFLLNIESLEALRGDFWVFLKSGFRQAFRLVEGELDAAVHAPRNLARLCSQKV